jgi:pyruvate dehydrogenase E2 component (dihydrolipoamide acetyltransferase)
MSQITMPKLSDSMEEGTILSWLKQDGEHVQAGEDLVEIETDKATVTHPAEASGVLKIIAAEGTSLSVGAAIAELGDGAAEVETTSRADRSPAATATAVGSGGVEPGAVAAPVAAIGTGNGAVRSTPLARRVAAAHGISLADVRGSGPRGRITRGDVLGKAGVSERRSPLPALATEPAGRAAAPVAPTEIGAVAATGVTAKGETEIQEPTRLQQVIARRMAEATATIPHFQVQTEVLMDDAIALRGKLKDLAGDDPAPSFNDLVIKAAAVALRAFPLANGSYKDASFELHSRINIGVAVAADGALVVPTVFDADGKSLGQISREVRRLAALVRDGKITPAELGGGTFTVSNLGMYGMTAITPVINAPQAAILGVGAMRAVLERVDGEIVDATRMTLTLSCDHRILYGAEAAMFLAHVRDLLQTPLKLAL